MVTATQFITIREQALLDLSNAVGELKDTINAGNTCDDCFKKIEDIFAQVRANAVVFAEKNDKLLPKWITGQKGKWISYSLGAANIVLILLNPALQAVQYHNDVESSPNCIKLALQFQDDYLKNVTSSSPIPSLQTLCDKIDDAAGPSFSLYMLIGTAVASALQGLALYGLDKYRNACDEYEKTKLQIENRTLINDELAAFFAKLKKFDKERSKRNLKLCTEALNQVANHKLVKKLGSKEDFVSTLFERVDDADFKTARDLLEQEIEREYQLREVSPRYPARRTKRKKHGERSGTLEEAERRRLSNNTVLKSDICNQVKAHLSEYDIDYMRLGKFWVDKNGHIATCEIDPILHRRGSDTPVETPFVIPV